MRRETSKGPLGLLLSKYWIHLGAPLWPLPPFPPPGARPLADRQRGGLWEGARLPGFGWNAEASHPSGRLRVLLRQGRH